jgi:hypothetical protein
MGDYVKEFCGSTDTLHIAETSCIIAPTEVICRVSQHCITALLLEQIQISGDSRTQFLRHPPAGKSLRHPERRGTDLWGGSPD